jgi:hypothetical protein
LAWERPLTPGTLLVTVRFWEMIPALPVIKLVLFSFDCTRSCHLLVWSRSHW